MDSLLGRLGFVEILKFEGDLSFMEFLLHVKSAEEHAKANGIWYMVEMEKREIGLIF